MSGPNSVLITTPAALGANSENKRFFSECRSRLTRNERYFFNAKIQMIQRLKATLLKIVTNVKSNPFGKQDIKSIVILRYDRIGDMIVSLPLCKALRLGFPTARITMIASTVNACIAEQCEFVDQTVIKPSRLLNWLWILLRLRAEKYDIAIDLNHAVTPHTIFAIRILSPKHVASPFKDGRWRVKGTELRLFDLMPPQHALEYVRPISETYLDIARLIDCPTQNCLPYPLRKHVRPPQIPTHYVVLNPTGSRPTMRLPDTDLSTIAEHLLSLNSSLHIVIPAMQSDYERLLSRFEVIPQVEVLSPSSSIKPLLPVIQFAQCVITPDTALVHIACAYGVPLVAVYSADEALFHQWQPYLNPAATVIRARDPKGLSGYSLADLLSSVTNKLM